MRYEERIGEARKDRDEVPEFKEFEANEFPDDEENEADF